MQLANGQPFTQTEGPTMNIITWFKRLLGIGPKGGSSTGTPVSSSSSASEMLRRVLELQRTNANWEAIFASLNPDRNPQVQHLINDLRGPHMFVPHLALSVLEEGCRRALAADPAADRIAALRAALRSSDPFR
jgi:hypothetical protein